jgi:DNA-directed RNA polymerase subunit RPC12/RpoP
MPLQNFKCKKCGKTFIDYVKKDNKCECGESSLIKLINLPLKEETRERVDNYRGVHAIKGIEEDLKIRSKLASYRDLDKTISEFGIEDAKCMGWVDAKGNKISKDEFLYGKIKDRKR